METNVNVTQFIRFEHVVIARRYFLTRNRAAFWMAMFNGPEACGLAQFTATYKRRGPLWRVEIAHDFSEVRDG